MRAARVRPKFAAPDDRGPGDFEGDARAASPPAGVDRRDQRETDPEWFAKEVATGPGWQRERIKNFNGLFTTDPEKRPQVDLVADQWSTLEGAAGILGDVHTPKDIEHLPEHVEKIKIRDNLRQERIRKRVEEEVKSPELAKKLQAWYPSWCKRPAFHDEYLSTFNRDNVTLLDTNGKGLDRITEDSIVIGMYNLPR